MYLNFYRLHKKPFRLAPDPEFLYLSQQHKDALGAIIYGIKERVVVPVEVRIGTIEGALDWDGVDPVGGRICCVSYAALALLVIVRCFLCIPQPVHSELLLPIIPPSCCVLIVPHTSPAPMHPMPCAPHVLCDADDLANLRNLQLNSTDVYHQGISEITASEIAIARRLGYVVKLLGIVERNAASGEISVRVHPTMVPDHHPLATVRDSFNAVFIEGDYADSLMFYGRGAVGAPTASAVFGDVVDAAVNLRAGTHGSLGELGKATIRPIDETSAEYLLGLDVADQPGVLHAVAGVFAKHRVSIRVAEQEGNGPEARLVFITHDALEKHVQATVRELNELDVVLKVGGLLRVIGD